MYHADDDRRTDRQTADGQTDSGRTDRQRTDRQTADGQTDMTKLIAAFRNFANAPKMVPTDADKSREKSVEIKTP